MKRLLSCIMVILSFNAPLQAKTDSTDNELNTTARKILAGMSLKDKIGQKLMLDFRYWCSGSPDRRRPCQEDMITLDKDIKRILTKHHIGGVILFSNNLHNIAQMTTLTHDLQLTMHDDVRLPLFIATDQEGGIVARLPRDATVTFPGNMALAAAHLGYPDANYAAEVGRMIAVNLKAVGININLAPDIDVNVNPQNPVINVRAFSDDPALTAQLGLVLSTAIQQEGIASTLKHFPGHGDTDTDSHLGLPIVRHSLQDAWQYDLFPYQHIIKHQSPDLIMTAHIQFPALDNSRMITSRSNEEINTPATLSRKIQTDILRQQLGFEGVTITDALDMGAISQHFTPTDATIKVFQAGIDIALMPVSITSPDDSHQLDNLIDEIESAITNHTLSSQELDESVLRIIQLKIKLGLMQQDDRMLPDKIAHAISVFSSPDQSALEEAVTNDAITLIQNRHHILPLIIPPHATIFILTPWLEQGAGIYMEIKKLQATHALPDDLVIQVYAMTNATLEAVREAIDHADIVITANSTTKSLAIQNPDNLRLFQISQKLSASMVLFEDASSSHENLSDAQFAYEALKYANNQGKKTIFISLLAPYDLPNYRDVADVLLASYNFYGYLQTDKYGYFRGPSMPALARIIFGIKHAKGRLPVDIPDPIMGNSVLYARGFGLTS